MKDGLYGDIGDDPMATLKKAREVQDFLAHSGVMDTRLGAACLFQYAIVTLYREYGVPHEQLHDTVCFAVSLSDSVKAFVDMAVEKGPES